LVLDVIVPGVLVYLYILNCIKEGVFKPKDKDEEEEEEMLSARQI